jgi:hypothetical protein
MAKNLMPLPKNAQRLANLVQNVDYMKVDGENGVLDAGYLLLDAGYWMLDIR